MMSQKSGPRVLPFFLSVFVWIVFANQSSKAQFVAFNDHAPGAGTSVNATTWNVFGDAPGSSGPLKDIATGATLPVTLTITTSGTGIGPAGTQGSPSPGTPLYNAFNTFVDFQGTPNPSIELSAGGLITYSFSGLNPNKRYSFMGSAVRGNGYTDRWTLFEIDGAVSFTSAHTTNVLTTTQVSLISVNQAALNTGVNNTPETGDMVVWENIDPGPEGTFAVTCQQYDGPVPNGSSAGVKGYGMTGLRLQEFDTAQTAVTITNQPQSQTIDEARPVTFKVGVSGNPPPKFQWYRGSSPINGETNASYTIPAVQVADDGAIFKVIATNTVNNVNYSVTSDTVTLHVNADTAAPALLSVQALGLDQVKVVFSERVDPKTATNIVNYTLTGNGGTIGISNASLDTNQTTILLNVSGLTEGVSYTLSISGVTDQAGAANVIAANTQRTFRPLAYAPLDIGTQPIAGGVAVAPGGYDVSGSGGDIGFTRDQFHFAYQQKTGDFDMRARIADLGITDSYVKAGLMARETLLDNSRFAAIFASSAQLGCFYESRFSISVTAAFAGPITKFPANYPWAWLRLRRSGNDFTGYGSFDGNAWQQLGTTNLTLPADVYFGMAVTSGATNNVTTAKFRDIGPTLNPTTFTYTPARENIGPSNRRTGLIFSEIMYHSKPRADGKNLDFVEIYNGESIFIDLSGWRITGGIDFTFPSGFQIGAGQFIVVAADPDAVKSVYGLAQVYGPFQKNLSDSEDTLTLLNVAGATRAEVTYSSKSPWPVSADGAGHSLVCLKPSYGEDDVRAWGASQMIGGSPGYDDPIVANPWAGVLINEFLAVPKSPDSSFIELYNASNAAVDLSGCFLTDSITTNKFKIPDATHIEARSWISFDPQKIGFALSSAGGFIYLVSADQSRVIDSIRYEDQEAGVSIGRSPDGSPTIRRLATQTPAQLNSPWKQEDIVINEIMYKPISGDSDDEYVELYNRSTVAVNLAGWRFNDGIDFAFPAGTSIAANGYLVVARNLQRMLTNYSQLNSANVIGDFSGKLKGGEHIALAKPGTNPNEFVTVSEVVFQTGGRWPELANGGGSSLELIDAHADPFLPSNWAASDETHKSTWASYEGTGVLNQANQGYAATVFSIMAQGTGEYLFDDIEVFRSGSTNILSNPGFESGATGWSFYGTHRTSKVQSTGAFSGANCLDVHAVEVGDEGPNSIRGLLTTTLAANSTVTIRARARWLSGWPELLMRIRGNGVEVPLKFQIPANLGTPGLPNSRKVNNAGPAITEVTHTPSLPSANQAVVVTARISDPDGIGSVQLTYRVDPSTITSSITMHDDGTGGDQLAGDGIYSATIPARASGLLAFRVQAQDLATTPVSNLFPSDAPTRECLIRWSDPAPFGAIAHYHLWSTAASSNDLNSSPPQDRNYRDITIVYDTRTIYNAGWRNKGSPFHSGVGSYSTSYADDDLFLGSDKHVLRSTGNGGDEATEMAGDMGYWIGEKLGLQFNHARYVRLYRNGSLHYRMDYDLEVPDRSIAKDWFGGGGLDDTLYKIAGWFEYSDSNTGGTSSLIWADLQKKPTFGPPLKTAAYRFNFQPHPGGRTANDYTLIQNIAVAANATDKVTQLMNLVDMEEWMRVLAHRRILGDWDSWSYRTGQNMYLYAPLGERARLMSWDMDFVLGLGDQVGVGNYFTSGSSDAGSVFQTLFNVPTYRRMLARAYLDAANGPLLASVSDPQFEARRLMLVKNNVGAGPPTSLKSYVASERANIISQMKSIDASAFSVTTQDFTTGTGVATVTGVAPVGIVSIEINGVPYPITWATTTGWSIKVPLGAPSNVLQFVGKDLRGNPYPNATGKITITYTGAVPQAADGVVINEIMYNASVNNAEFVELLNTHPTYAFDLSGYKLKGADFTFPPGTFIQPNGFLVVARDSAAFAGAYGSTIPIVGEYAGSLQNSGETLTLVKPGPPEVVIDQVYYANTFPWPTTADGLGPSLQRVDAAQDSWRAGNWGVTAVNDPNRATPGRTNSIRALLDPFPQVWINEVLPNNQAGAKDSSGENDPWIELYNSGSTPVDLSLFYLSNDPLNRTQWQFPAGTTLGPGAFLLVWADGQTEQNSATELHTNFRISAAGGIISLNRIQAGAAATIDYLYYPATSADQSYGSIADGNPQTERYLFVPTPGGPNNPGNLIVPITINEWMPSNLRIIQDPADGDFDDWFELYNAGDTTVDLTGYFLSNTSTNSTKFKIPAGYTIPPHGFLLAWADDEITQNLPTRPDLHVNFKLAKDGDAIAFFTPNGALLDSISFTALGDNISGGRYPDGATALVTFVTPSPKAANIAPPGTRFTGISVNGAQLNISWRTTAGRSYQLEYKSDLTQPAWTALGDALTATTTTLSVSVDLPVSARYFRVAQVN